MSKKEYIIAGLIISFMILTGLFCPEMNAEELPPLEHLSKEQSYELGKKDAFLEAAAYIKDNCRGSHTLKLHRVDKAGDVVKVDKFSCYPLVKVSNPIRMF